MMKRILYFVLLIAALLVYSSMSYAFGNLPDGWFDGKPVTPPEPPPVFQQRGELSFQQADQRVRAV